MFVVVPTHMVEEGFAFVGGGEGVDGGEKAKVEGEEVRVGGVSAFLKGRDNQLRVSMEMAIGVDVPKIRCKFHGYDGCFIFGLVGGVKGDALEVFLTFFLSFLFLGNHSPHIKNVWGV